MIKVVNFKNSTTHQEKIIKEWLKAGFKNKVDQNKLL